MTDDSANELADDILLAAVGDMLDSTEPLRHELVDSASADAFAMRSIDAELADLVHDSASAASGTRAQESFRTISFNADGVEIEIQFSDDEIVFGRIDPPDVSCTIEGEGDAQELNLDEFGRFTTTTRTGRLRIVVTLGSERRIATPWIFR